MCRKIPKLDFIIFLVALIYRVFANLHPSLLSGLFLVLSSFPGSPQIANPPLAGDGG